MFFWNSLAFSMTQQMLAIWSLVPLPFLIQLEHLEVHNSHTGEAWLGEFWALLCQCVRWMQLCLQNKTQFPSQSVSPIRELPKASYPYLSEGRQNENHNHRKLIKLITWTTALSNSMKLWAMPCKATQDEQIMVESSNKMWSRAEGNGKPLQSSSLENPMDSMKKQKDMTLKDILSRSSRCPICYWRKVEK